VLRHRVELNLGAANELDPVTHLAGPRPGTSFWADLAGEERRHPPQHLILLLQPLVAAPQLAQLSGFIDGRPRHRPLRLSSQGFPCLAAEPEATAQEHGRKEPVLVRTGPVPDHPDEPQEGDAGRTAVTIRMACALAVPGGSRPIGILRFRLLLTRWRASGFTGTLGLDIGDVAT
jgi:hypothetical protein